MKNNVYDVIKSLCDEKGTSISQLEKELRFGVSTISKWKTQSPSADRLSDVANYFNISIDYLMGRTLIKKTSDKMLKDSHIISFQRAMDKMPTKDKTKAMNILKSAFEDAFSEEDGE